VDLLLIKLYQGDEINEEIDGTRSIHGRNEKCIQNY
jgi:hypothetical protein